MEVQDKFDTYPANILPLLLRVRSLILKIASDQNLGEVNESLKWGEPSFQVRTGSAIRIDWKSNAPEHYFIFFNCNTKLVETFRELHSDVLQFQGNRAIVLAINDRFFSEAIYQCLEMAMKYKKVKHLPLLGA